MKIKASILDYSFPFLDPAVWDHDRKLFAYQKDFILRLVSKMYETYGLVQPETWVEDIVIIGSLTTSKWLLSSDLDVHIRVNLDAFIASNMPGSTKEQAFEKLDLTRKEFDRAKILAPMTQHPIEFYFESIEFKPSNIALVGVYSMLQDVWLKEPITFDADLDFEESKKDVVAQAEALAEELDGSLGKIRRDIQRVDELEAVIQAWGKDKQQLFYAKVEQKLQAIEAEILKDLQIKQDLVDARHADQNATSDIEIKFKWLARFGFFGILSNLKTLLEQTGGKVTTQELPLIDKIISQAGQVFEVNGVRMWKNPSMDQVKKIFANSKDLNVRYVIDPNTNDMFIWDAYNLHHMPAMEGLGIEWTQEVYDNFTGTISSDDDIESLFTFWQEGGGERKVASIKEAFLKEAFEKERPKEFDTDICVDFDKTIAQDAKYPEIGEPIEGAKESLEKLKEMGYNIVIYSCRGDSEDGLERITKWLDDHDMPYDSIFKGDKPFFKYVIDDKAIHFDSWKNVMTQVDKSDKKASLSIVASISDKFWIDPQGKVYKIGGRIGYQDVVGHLGWIEANKALLTQTYSFEFPDDYWTKSQGIDEIADFMISNGWTRITNETGIDFDAEVSDLMHLPSYLDNFTAENFQGLGIGIDDLDGNYVKITDPFPSLQKAVVKELRNPVNASLNKKAYSAIGTNKYWITPQGKTIKIGQSEMHIDWVMHHLQQLANMGVDVEDLSQQFSFYKGIYWDDLDGGEQTTFERIMNGMQNDGWVRITSDDAKTQFLIDAGSAGFTQGVDNFIAQHFNPNDGRPIGAASKSHEYLEITDPFPTLEKAYQKAARGGKRASLDKKAGYDHAYWIDPAGKIFQVRGADATGTDIDNGDADTHTGWILKNLDMLKKDYGIESDGINGISGTNRSLIELGWIRVGDAYGTDWGITVNSLSSIPSSVDDLLAQFAPEGAEITVSTPGMWQHAVTFEWPVKSVQQAVTQGLQRQQEKPSPELQQAAKQFSKRDIVAKTKKVKQGDYSCLMALVPHELAQEIVEWGVRNVPDEDLYLDEDGKLGRELESHITIKYGILTDDAKHIRRSFNDAKPLHVKLGKVRHFEPPELPFDVLTVEVISEDLEKANKKVCDKFDCAEGLVSDEYHPHITIAYMKRGKSKDYIGYDGFDGKEVELDTLIFSPHKGNRTYFSVSNDKESSFILEQINKIASMDVGYWVSPKGEVWDVHGQGLTHNDWILAHLADLRNEGFTISPDLDQEAMEYFKAMETGEEDNFDPPYADDLWGQMIRAGWVRVGDADEGLGIELNDFRNIPSFMDSLIGQDLHDGDFARVDDINHNSVTVQYPFKSLQQAVNKALSSPTKTAEFLPSMAENAPTNNWQFAEGGDDVEIALQPDSVSDDETSAEPCTTGKPRTKDVWRQFMSIFRNPFSKKEEMTVDSAYDPKLEQEEKDALGEDETLLEYSKGFYDPKKHDFPHNTTWDSLTQDGEPSKPTSVTYSPQISNEDNLDQNSPGGFPRRFMGKPKGEWFSDEGEIVPALENMWKYRNAALEGITKEAFLQHAYWIDPAGKVFQVRDTENLETTHYDWINSHLEMLKDDYGITIGPGMLTPQLISKGWTRIGDSVDAEQWQVEVADLHAIPKAVDNTLAQFAPEGANIDFADSHNNFVTLQWPWKNSQSAVNRALRQPVTAGITRQYALYIGGRLATRTLTRQKALKLCQVKFPAQFAAGDYEIKEEAYKVSKQASIEEVNGVRIFVDPTWQEAVALLNNSKEKNLRGIVDPWTGGNLYLWDSYSLTHENVVRALGLGIEAYPEEEKYQDLLSQIGDEASLRWIFDMQQKVRKQLARKRKASVDIEHTKDWVKRHQTPLDAEGRAILYHGTPKTNAEALRSSGLRQWSLLANTPEEAIHFTGRDRDLKPKDISVFEVHVPLEKLNGGVFASVAEALGPEYLKEVAVTKTAGNQSASVPDYLCEEWKTEQINNDTDEEPYVNHDQRDYPYGMHDSPENTGNNIGWPKDEQRSIVHLDTLENPAYRLDPFGIGSYNVIWYNSLPASDGIEKMNPE